jgi:BTB/POZ domain
MRICGFLRFRTARDARNQHFEKLFGTVEVPMYAERPILEVTLPEALPEAFEMVLHYIYTDRIDCENFC